MPQGLKLASIALLFSASAVVAQTADVVVTSDYLRMSWEKVSAQVPYGDLNLSTPKGVDILNSRVKAEATKLCGTKDQTLVGKTNHKTCYDQVIASADPQIARLAANAKK